MCFFVPFLKNFSVLGDLIKGDTDSATGVLVVSNVSNPVYVVSIIYDSIRSL